MKVEEAYLDVLQNIEFAIANEYRANLSLTDRDVLHAIQTLIRQYAAQQRHQKHVPSTHLTPHSMNLLESVKTICERRLGRSEREEADWLRRTGAPIDLEELLPCLKRIRSSIQHWTHVGGPRSYLDYMSSFQPLEKQPTEEKRLEMEPTMHGIPDDVWRHLYDLALRVRGLAAWEWMSETDVFGVKMPLREETIFVSVMGTLGEHFAVAVYPHADAVRKVWEIEQDDERDEESLSERVLEIPQVHVSFESSSQLLPEDRQLMKHLNLSTKGTVALFRSYKPGFVPWFVDPEEAEMLRVAMEQLLEVAPRFRLDSSLLWPEAESDVCLIRVPQHNGPNATWIDDFREVAPSRHSSVYVELDNGLITRYRRLPLMKTPMEIDFFLVPEGIVDNGGRPKMPYALMIVDSAIGVVLACDVVIIETSMSAIWAGLCNRLLEKFINIGARPVSLTVRPGHLAVIAAALSEVLGFHLRTHRKLLSLNRAKAGLLRHMTENSDR